MSEPLVEIDLAALRWNWSQVVALASPVARLLPVVKSDAYGHGMVAVARELAALGAWGFAVSGLEEALELRAAGFAHPCPVVLLMGARFDEAAEVCRARLTPVVFDLGEAEALGAAAAARGLRLPIHIKVDTGMGRLGFSPPELARALPRLATMASLSVEGVCSHLAAADLDDDYSRGQLARFEAAVAAVRAAGLTPRLLHLANSAAILGLPGMHLTLARPGIMLYGSYPSERLREKALLRPLMRLSARVLQVKQLERGQSVSYGCTYRASGPERVAVIGCGYSHGYNRALSGKAAVLIRGRRAPVRGRVCMNALVVSVDGIPGATPGDEAVLLGSQGTETITAEELASLAGTISYEFFCAIGRLARKRVYLGAASAEEESTSVAMAAATATMGATGAVIKNE
jgi:alanine racemase